MDEYNTKKRPLILVCGHTFCEICLSNMFEDNGEILCCFCKVITKLERFDDMIVNYAILSLAEHPVQLPKSGVTVNQNNFCKCKVSLTEDKIDKLLRCVECNSNLCSTCLDNTHEDHKILNYLDFLEEQSTHLNENMKFNREILNKMILVYKKIDKFEIEKLVKIEKESVGKIFRDLRSLLDKNQEIINHSIDRFHKDSLRSLDNFKKETKVFNSDLNRYTSIIEELLSLKFKSTTPKQRMKIMNIYNIDLTLEEIGQFNKDVVRKQYLLKSADSFTKNFAKILQNIFQYRKKCVSFHERIQKKLASQLNIGFEKKFIFFNI
jgi:hypothetical protein